MKIIKRIAKVGNREITTRIDRHRSNHNRANDTAEMASDMKAVKTAILSTR